MPSSETANPYEAVLRELMRDRRRAQRAFLNSNIISRTDAEDVRLIVEQIDRELAHLLRRLDNPYVW